MTAAERRRIKQATDLKALHAWVDELERRIRAKVSKSLAPGKTKDERRAEHREATGDLRAFVAERMNGYCEACGETVGVQWDMHHVESGGSRRAKQRPGSVLGICWNCHRQAHRGNWLVLALIAQAHPLDAEAEKAARKRLAKVEEARRGTP